MSTPFEGPTWLTTYDADSGAPPTGSEGNMVNPAPGKGSVADGVWTIPEQTPGDYGDVQYFGDFGVSRRSVWLDMRPLTDAPTTVEGLNVNAVIYLNNLTHSTSIAVATDRLALLNSEATAAETLIEIDLSSSFHEITASMNEAGDLVDIYLGGQHVAQKMVPANAFHYGMTAFIGLAEVRGIAHGDDVVVPPEGEIQFQYPALFEVGAPGVNLTIDALSATPNTLSADQIRTRYRVGQGMPI